MLSITKRFGVAIAPCVAVTHFPVMTIALNVVTNRFEVIAIAHSVAITNQ
jgi:hypothetical protein